MSLSCIYRLRKIYWTDALKDRIEVCDFNGKKRKEIVQHATYPFGVALSDTHVFWTDWYNKSVFRASKNGSMIGAEIRHGLRGALDIRSVSKKRQPIDLHPCTHENGGCTHLCLFTGQSYVCGCPDVADDRPCKIEPNFVVPYRPDDHSEYSDSDDMAHVPSSSNENVALTNYHTKVVIIATGILCGVLIIVVAAILCKTFFIDENFFQIFICALFF